MQIPWHRSPLFLLPTFLAAIGPGFWAPQVIGDFHEGDARMFLEEQLSPGNSGIAVDDDAWAKVYKVQQICCLVPCRIIFLACHGDVDSAPKASKPCVAAPPTSALCCCNRCAVAMRAL